MKRAIVIFGIIILRVVYKVLKCLPTKDKVTFISRQSDEPNIDFIMLVEELKKSNPEIETVMLCKRIKRNLKDAIGYSFHMLLQAYHMATSKVVVLDSYCIIASNLRHKKGLKIIQIWHALGALKKFGYSILDMKEGSNSKFASMMNMHRNYDYVLASTELARVPYSEAFNIDIDKIVVIPLPKVDICLDESLQREIAQRIIASYPKLDLGKRNILYVPTFRKDKKVDYAKVVNAIDYDKFNLIIKLHSGYEEVYYSKNEFKRGKKFTGFEFLTVSDHVISDYSAITFEAAVMNKPIYLYIYDYEEYNINRGLYIDFEKEMPGPISKDIESLVKIIESDTYDMEKLKAFANKYVVTEENRSCTERLVQLIIN